MLEKDTKEFYSQGLIRTAQNHKLFKAEMKDKS